MESVAVSSRVHGGMVAPEGRAGAGTIATGLRDEEDDEDEDDETQLAREDNKRLQRGVLRVEGQMLKERIECDVCQEQKEDPMHKSVHLIFTHIEDPRGFDTKRFSFDCWAWSQSDSSLEKFIDVQKTRSKWK